MVDHLEQHIEALIFSSEQSLEIYDIKHAIREALDYELEHMQLEKHLSAIQEKYSRNEFAIELKFINNGYQFLTKRDYHKIINQLQLQRSKKKLSQSAMETLAIVAYRQPVTKLEIEQIRGVNSDYSIQKLLEKDLIQICGKSESIGKPLLYGTSSLFMDYFGINNASDLPKLNDVIAENEGTADKRDS